MAWTEDRVEVLTKLWAEGLSASQIAKQLGGVTRNAVIGKVHRLGLSGRGREQHGLHPRRVSRALLWLLLRRLRRPLRQSLWRTVNMQLS